MTAVSNPIRMQAETRVKPPDSDEEYDDHNSRDGSNSSQCLEENRAPDEKDFAGEDKTYEERRFEKQYEIDQGSREERKEDKSIYEDNLRSSFSMHNVLKVKSERDSNSPENVFSTGKLMENTPTCEKDDSRNSSSLPTPSPRFEMSPERHYSNPESVRAEINVDDESCCSDDTVLSVGNETPVYHEAQKSADNSTAQGLTTFKHLQSHLNAISQLSQNVMNQPLLLRPNPVTPNPLMFLNQSHLLFQNPLLNQMEPKHPSIGIQPRMGPIVPNSPVFGLSQFRPKNGIQNQRLTDENRRYPKSPESDDERREMILNQNLKFSIDNILKADFGRRITDPLKQRKPKVRIVSESVSPKEFKIQKPLESRPLERSKESRVPDPEKTDKGAIDLSKSDESSSGTPGGSGSEGPIVWPAWVYCTRYSDRPSSGPRTRRPKKTPGERSPSAEEKRPRTAFSGPQLARLKHEFAENRYLTERRRQQLAAELGLAEAQIKIWFQNKRAKIKKASGQRNPLALQLMAQGLYNHSTVPLTREEEELQELQARESREKQAR